MFKPRLVIRDQRSFSCKVRERFRKLFSNETIVIVPDNKATFEYVSRTTKGIFTGAVLAASCFVGVVLYQTINPTFEYTVQTESLDVAIKNKQHPVYTNFPYVDRKQKDSDTQMLDLANLTSEQYQRHFTCLAKNVYFEARSEDVKGHLAVGLVTLNRVTSDKFPDTICDVVWQDRQFSWTHDGMSDEPTDQEAWCEAKQIADFLMTPQTVEHLHDFTDNALYYHANYVKPYWNKSYTKTAQVGLHTFYKLNE